MSVIKTNAYRQLLAQELYDRLAAGCFLAIGTGGHNPDNTPKPPDPGQTTLVQEVLRLNGNVSVQNDYLVEVQALFPLQELEPYTEISEIGLYLDENLLAVRNTTPTVVDPNNTLDGFNATIIFPF